MKYRNILKYTAKYENTRTLAHDVHHHIRLHEEVRRVVHLPNLLQYVLQMGLWYTQNVAWSIWVLFCMEMVKPTVRSAG